MAKIPFDTQSIIQSFVWRQIDAVNQTLEIAKTYAESISPTDTETFINNHEIIPAEFDWKRVVWMLVNKTPYAKILEFGVKGNTYNYHKGSRKNKARKVIYTWVGNRTYQRTLDATRFTFRKKLAWG